MLTNSILAGVMIGIGDIALMSCDNKYIGALLFGVALMTIITFQLPLYTGRIGSVIEYGDYLFCAILLALNVVGVTLAIGGYTLLSPDNYQKVVEVANQKFGRGYLALFIAGIFCNILIHVAVRSKHSILVVLCVMCFILCGFEHSIADAGYAFVTGWRNILVWLIVVAGNTVGGLFTYYFLHDFMNNEVEVIEDGESGE